MRKFCALKRVLGCSLIGWILVGGIFINLSAAVDMHLPYPEDASIRLGDGFDMLSLRSIPDGCFISTAGDMDNYPGAIADIKAQMINTSEDYVRSYAIAFNASYEGFGLEMSGGIENAKEDKLSTNNITILATVKVIKLASRLQSFALKPEAQEILQQGRYVEFHDLFGHKFIKAIRKGGFLSINITIHTRDESHKEEIKQKLSAKGVTSVGTFGLDQNFSSALNEVKQSASISISVHSVGGTGADNAITTWEAALERINRFPTEIADSGYPLEMELGEYTDLIDYKKYMTGSGSYLDADQYQALSDYYVEYFHYQTLLHNLSVMIDHPESFYYHPSSLTTNELYGLADSIRNLLTEMKKRMRDYRGNEDTLYTNWDSSKYPVNADGTFQLYRNYITRLIAWSGHNKILPLRWRYNLSDNPLVTLQPTPCTEKFYFSQVINADRDIWQTVKDRLFSIYTSSYYQSSGEIITFVNAFLYEDGFDWTTLRATGSWVSHKLPKYTYADSAMMHPFKRTDYPRPDWLTKYVNLGTYEPFHGYMSGRDNNHSMDPPEITVQSGVGLLRQATLKTGSPGDEAQEAYITDIQMQPIQVQLKNIEPQWNMQMISSELRKTYLPALMVIPPSETQGWEELK